jgi:hypothetical protein
MTGRDRENVTRVDVEVGPVVHVNGHPSRDAVAEVRDLARVRLRNRLDVLGPLPAWLDELTLEVGRRLQLDDVVVVEWTGNYGDGRLYRNVTIGELEDGHAVRVTDYWGEPTETPGWRKPLTDRLNMPGDGIWPDAEHLGHY